MELRIFDHMEECTEQEVVRMLQLVSESRRVEALRYSFLFGQFACLKSYMMLLPLVGSEPWIRNEHGKPYITDGLQFSLSHCKNAIAVVADKSPVGIDVESIRSINTDLIEYTMNKEESARIHEATDPDFEFIRLWTMKEAYLKYIGTGIRDDMKEVLSSTLSLSSLHFETSINKDKRYICTVCHE